MLLNRGHVLRSCNLMRWKENQETSFILLFFLNVTKSFWKIQQTFHTKVLPSVNKTNQSQSLPFLALVQEVHANISTESHLTFITATCFTEMCRESDVKNASKKDKKKNLKVHQSSGAGVARKRRQELI